MARLSWFLRIGIIAVAAWVLTGLTPLILEELGGGDACPMLGPVPACYPVGLGYVAMAVAVMLSPRRFTVLFLAGWAPVFLLALGGSTMEIMGHNTCPISPAGTPLCFYSLSIATLLLPVFFLSRNLQRSNKDKNHKAGI